MRGRKDTLVGQEVVPAAQEERKHARLLVGREVEDSLAGCAVDAGCLGEETQSLDEKVEAARACKAR